MVYRCAMGCSCFLCSLLVLYNCNFDKNFISKIGLVLEFEMWCFRMNQTLSLSAKVCVHNRVFGGMYGLAVMMSISTLTTCKNIDKMILYSHVEYFKINRCKTFSKMTFSANFREMFIYRSFSTSRLMNLGSICSHT